MSKTAMKLALEALDNLMYWDNGKPDYDQARQAITALREALANEALDKMAENARELGLDYEPSSGTQVSKVWWDGERLMAERIPFVEFYKPVQQEPVSFLDWYDNAHWGNEDFKDGCWRAWNAALAQRTWVGLSDEDLANCTTEEYETARYWEAKLRSKNNA